MIRMRVLAVLSLAVAFASPAAFAQTKPSKSTTSKKVLKKKKPKKKKPGSAQTPVEMGDLDEPASGVPAGGSPTAPAAAGATSAASAADESDDAEEPTSPGASASKADKGDPQEATGGGAGTNGAPRPLSAALLIGFGVNGAPCGRGACNAYGLGFGLRGGYTLPIKLYVGGTFVYHLGYNRQEPVANTTFARGFTGGVAYFGPEIGYDFSAGPVLVRPYAGLGVGLLRRTDTPFGSAAVPNDTGGTRFVLFPGVTGLLPIGPLFQAGLDARFVLMPAGESGFAFFASGGVRL